jgi:cytochrome o ubiquinol oxidase subunit 2
MRFKFHGLTDADFDAWVKQGQGRAARRWTATTTCSWKAQRARAGAPLRAVAPGLYDAILNRCVDRNKMCMNQMMAIDAAGGNGQGRRLSTGSPICRRLPMRRPLAGRAPRRKK